MGEAARLPQEPASLSERIAAAYLTEAGGDPLVALHAAIRDAVTDLCEMERRTLQRDRLISHGYERKALHAAQGA